TGNVIHLKPGKVCCRYFHVINQNKRINLISECCNSPYKKLCIIGTGLSASLVCDQPRYTASQGRSQVAGRYLKISRRNGNYRANHITSFLFPKPNHYGFSQFGSGCMKRNINHFPSIDSNQPRDITHITKCQRIRKRGLDAILPVGTADYAFYTSFHSNSYTCERKTGIVISNLTNYSLLSGYKTGNK